MIKYAGKLENTFHTSGAKTRKMCWYLLSCKYEFSGADSKPDCSSILFDKINGCHATIGVGRCLYGYATSKTGSSRKEFNRLLEDCNSRKIEIVITKNISRFGRDTVEILDALNQLRTLGVRVIFEQEELDTANTDSDLMISIIESLAQAENESRSDNIRWGIKQRAASGTSKLYDRKCYGYKHDKEGHLIIDEETAKNVKLIFDLYLSGQSVIGLIKELEKRKILSPTGKEKWCKRTIDVMLSNEKYTGDVKLLKSGNSEVQYLSTDNNPAIISKEVFEAVQVEKARRSNVVRSGNGTQRKSKKYSSKRK